MLEIGLYLTAPGIPFGRRDTLARLQQALRRHNEFTFVDEDACLKLMSAYGEEDRCRIEPNGDEIALLKSDLMETEVLKPLLSALESALIQILCTVGALPNPLDRTARVLKSGFALEFRFFSKLLDEIIETVFRRQEWNLTGLKTER